MFQKARIPEDKNELGRNVGSLVDVMVAEKNIGSQCEYIDSDLLEYD